MALIKCGECGKEISDKAGACPSCGDPIHTQSQATTVPEEKKVVEIEQTSKKWKKTSIWALAFVIFGILSLGINLGFGFFLIFLGFIFTVISRVGAWWTNG
jgi:uncharacterized membrane protein YvbJ